MAYSNTISALDFSAGIADVRVSAGYTWTVVGGNHGPVDQKQEEVTPLDIPSNIFQPGPHTFSYTRNLIPTPSPAWFVALWIQEIPRIVNDTGWLFRSGEFTTEPPPDPIEIILAPEQLIGTAELAGAVSVPTTTGSTTITAITLTVVGADIALVATGTDTGLPSGDTFVFTATLILFPNSSVQQVDSPFDIRMTNPSLGFIAGVGQGFVTALLNAISGIIVSNITPKVTHTVKSQLNSGILSSVASRVNRGVPSTMPAGVVLSIRGIRSTTRTNTSGVTESVIGVNASLGAFGGVVSKFPALSTSGTCFIATAALDPNAPELEILRAWRDDWMRPAFGGRTFIALYERFSPPIARRIAKSSTLRTAVRKLVIAPASRVATRVLDGAKKQKNVR